MEKLRPVPKPNHKRRKPTRRKRGAFDKDTRDQIIDRDDELCRVCKSLGRQIHHVKPKGSSKGRGVFTNGMLVCNDCHADIHRYNDKLVHWQRQFEIMYGADYYKDDWDKEW